MSKELTATQFKGFFDMPERKKAILSNLPKTVSPDVFMSSIYALSMSEAHRMADRTVILQCVYKAARDGLVLDGREAAIVPFKGKMTYVPMIAGVVKRLINTGNIAEISTQMVYENDTFDLVETHKGTEMLFRRCLRGDRGAMIGAFARINFLDGGQRIEYMTLQEINKHRPAHAGASSPWGTNYVEMCLKTVLKKATKLCVLSAEQYKILERGALQEEEEIDIEDVTPQNKDVPQIEAQDEFEIASDGIVEEGVYHVQEDTPEDLTNAMSAIIKRNHGGNYGD